MQVIHFSTSDIQGGAARAAYRISKALSKVYINSYLITKNKNINDPMILQVNGKKMIDFEVPSLTSYLNRKKVPFSTAREGVDISINALLKGVDIINLHWINSEFLSLDSLKRLGSLRKPIVWTLHDMWPFTGGCHYSGDCKKYEKKCGNCPILKSNQEEDLTRQVWLKKKKVYNKLDLTIVTCSQWLAECVSKSSLFRNLRVEVIPNPIDIDVFKPANKRIAREILNLSDDKSLVLFGAVNATNDKRKGFSYLKKCLNYLNSHHKFLDNKLELLVFGSSHSDEIDNFPYKVSFMGTLKDDYTLALCYSAADVFIAPSLEENLPNTIMEALSCGTPVVAFKTGGIPDMVEHMQNGYLAEYKSAEDLAEGIRWVLEDKNRWKMLSENARKKVVDNYTYENVGERYLNLYESLLAKDTEVKDWSKVYINLKNSIEHIILGKYLKKINEAKRPSIRDVIQVMNRVWDDLGLHSYDCNEKKLEEYRLHPIWRFYDSYIESDPTMMNRINLITTYFNGKENLNILVYGNGIKALSCEIAKKTVSSRITIYNYNNYSLKDFKENSNINLINSLEHKNYYDVVVCMNLFEQVKEPIKLLEKINNLIKIKGTLIVYWNYDVRLKHNLLNNFHLQYTLEKIIKTFGFYKEESLEFGKIFKKQNEFKQEYLNKAVRQIDKSTKLFPYIKNSYFEFSSEFIDFVLSDSNEKVAIFGAGELGKNILNIIKDTNKGIEVKYFLDNDEAKWNRKLANVSVKKPELSIISKVNQIIIASIYGKDAIKKQLLNMGLKEKNIISISE